MSSQKRITRAYETAKKIPFNDSSKFIIFSDVHRGDNSLADDFANNGNTYFHALNYYYEQGYTYCELGDGDELWENPSFKSILYAHKDVFKLLGKFYSENRMHRVLGNHDMVFENSKVVEKYLQYYVDNETDEKIPLFPGVSFTEGLVLHHEDTQQEIFMLHGHQADWRNYKAWKVNRFMVLALWKQLQVFGIGDPTSPAKNFRELKKVERRFNNWIKEHENKITIIGHTHRPRFPNPGELALFNDGSCVHPRSITGIEIDQGSISLIKWHITTTREGVLKVTRKVLEGPNPLINYSK